MPKKQILIYAVLMQFLSPVYALFRRTFTRPKKYGGAPKMTNMRYAKVSVCVGYSQGALGPRLLDIVQKNSSKFLVLHLPLLSGEASSTFLHVVLSVSSPDNESGDDDDDV